MKKTSLKLMVSVIMLVLTAAMAVSVTVAWLAVNREVGGSTGNTDISYNENGGSADFRPGDGFGSESPSLLFAGDRTEYKFSLKNDSDNDKNYVFSFNDLFVTYPAATVKSEKNYYNIAVADGDYKICTDEAADTWVGYNGLREAKDAEKAAFYEKFVTPVTNAIKIAIVEDTDNGATALDELIANNKNNFVALTDVSSYFDRRGNTDFYGATEGLDVDGEGFINNKLESFTMTVAAGNTVSYRFIVVFDENEFATTTVGGVTYRMMNSNAFMWQKLSATVVVKEVR